MSKRKCKQRLRDSSDNSDTDSWRIVLRVKTEILRKVTSEWRKFSWAESRSLASAVLYRVKPSQAAS
jgi:hypothetical protein